jgi:hypothetical protein
MDPLTNTRTDRFAHKTMNIALILIGIYTLLGISLFAGLVYVAVHFISKIW